MRRMRYASAASAPSAVGLWAEDGSNAVSACSDTGRRTLTVTLAGQASWWVPRGIPERVLRVRARVCDPHVQAIDE